MSFRDDREAAHARADALERELAEKERALAEKERALAEKERALHAAEEKLAEVEDARDEVTAAHEQATASEQDARARLDEVASRTEQRRRAAERATRAARQRERDEAQEERQRRMNRSVSLWADIEWFSMAVLLLLPTIYGTMFTTIKFGRIFLFIVPGGVFGLMVLTRLLTPWWCRRQLRREYEWAEAHRIAGYPEILESRPRDRDSFPNMGSAGGHTEMTVALRFTGAPPPELDAIMRGAELEPDGPGRFSRKSPVTHRRTRRGSIVGIEDHNRAIRKAVHALDRDVLAPLRTAHGLTEAVITLHE